VGFEGAAIRTVDFIARLASLVPKPRVNLTRYHGVLAPNHRWRGAVTPARRGKTVIPLSTPEVRSPAERHAAMTWAQRLKRVFNIDIETCNRWRVVTAEKPLGLDPCVLSFINERI
jgi:hypothetical protein